ncbi:MAG: hypothetical protein EPN22_15515 [Nitrospirae bacterium]|nr:MAG: hypothetical protein EPN22_15515 [Nitrospirota bacterium]
MTVKFKIQFFMLFLFLMFLITNAFCADSKQEAYAVLKAAEDSFLAMKKAKKDNSVVTVAESKNYLEIWNFLTDKSRETILKDVYKEEKKTGFRKDLTLKDVETNFSECKELCVTYWYNFLTAFDPEMVLSQSKWEMGFIKGDKAEIIVTYKTAQQPAKLKMFKENGSWKFGLVETFWVRR